MKRSFIIAARRFARDNKQGFGKEVLDLFQKVEAAILQRRLAEPVQAGTEENRSDPIIEELAELRARMRRIEELLERLGADSEDTRPEGPPAQPVRLVPGEEFGADRHISPFDGFYPVEVDPAAGMFRWTGPSHEFLFHLDIDRARPVRLELRVLGGVQPEQCEGISLIADGHPIPLSINRANPGYNLGFNLPARQSKSLTALIFIVPRLFRPVDQGGGSDIRALGVRFHALKMLA